MNCITLCLKSDSTTTCLPYKVWASRVFLKIDTFRFLGVELAWWWLNRGQGCASSNEGVSLITFVLHGLGCGSKWSQLSSACIVMSSLDVEALFESSSSDFTADLKESLWATCKYNTRKLQKTLCYWLVLTVMNIIPLYSENVLVVLRASETLSVVWPLCCISPQEVQLFHKVSFWTMIWRFLCPSVC